MKTFFVIILFVLFIFESFHSKIFAQGGWSTIQSPTNAWLEDIQAVNQTNIYAVGLGYTIIKSTDEGSTWSIQYSGANYYNFYSVSFVNPNTGYATGGYEPNPPASHDGSIFKTTNGGVNWSNIYNGGGSAIWQIFSIDSLHAFCCSNFYSLKTTDGGLSWSVISGLISASSIYFINQNTGYAATASSIRKTTDGGFSWNSTNLSQGSLVKVVFADSNTGYVTGYSNNHILKTTNEGLNWSSPISVPDLAYSNNIYCLNKDTVYVVGSFQPTYYYGRIIRTTNGGQNWTTQYAGTVSYTMPYSISFVNALTGFAVGPVGLILKTTTGGEIPVSSNNQSVQVPVSLELYQNFPNPFNPTTKIKFDIPQLSNNMHSLSRQFVNLSVFSVEGKVVASLVNGNLKSGSYDIDFNATELPSGIYFYRLKTNYGNKTKKMVLLR